MFNIVSKRNDRLVIYKSVMVDAATCIYKNKNQGIAAEAECAISNMLIEMDNWFVGNGPSGQKTGKTVRLQFLKNKDSDFVELTSMNSFKLWLIKMLHAESFSMILSRLKDYCMKNGTPLPELNIVFGDHIQERIYNTDVYFRNSYRTDWLRSEIINSV